MKVVNITSNFIATCAKRIIEINSNQYIIIVPEKSCISPLTNAIAGEIQTGIIPKIISIEGLLEDDTIEGDTLENTTPANQVISRNVIFAKVFEITARHISNELDASTFTRAIIGELPNLYASSITPRQIINNIPATISLQKEVNINLFVKIWEELNSWIQSSEMVPYYATQENALASIILNCENNGIHINILHDFNRSPILLNCIKSLKSSEIPTTVFIQNYNASSDCFNEFHNLKIETAASNNKQSPDKPNQLKVHATSTLSEEMTIAQLVLKELQGGTQASNSAPSIGIICEDETLGKKISLALTHNNIKHQHSIATSIESNALIKLFIAIFEQKPEKMLPLLKVTSDTKKQILYSIVNKTISQHSLWNGFLQLFPRKSAILKTTVMDIFSHIEHCKTEIHTTKGEFPTFLQFKHFVLKEINGFDGLTVEKSIIMHIATSWKLWEVVMQSNIKICNLRTVLFQQFDAIILTSAYATQPTGNVIFSCGMRAYYGFGTPDISTNIIQTIATKIIFTGQNSPFDGITQIFAHTPPSVRKTNNNAQLAISKTQMPRTLSATQIETLFESPLTFYYQYIKGIKAVQYTTQISLEIGNFLHAILEFATKEIIKNPQFNYTAYTENALQKENGGKFKGFKVFYIKSLLKILGELSQNAHTRTTNVEIQGMFATVENGETQWIITAKPDRIDILPNSATIYDYKSGSATSFTKNSIKNLEKIQLLIPAMALIKNNHASQQMFGNYTFLEHSVKKNVEFEISQEKIDAFKTKLLKSIELYVENGEILPTSQNMRDFNHACRTL